MNIQPNPNKNDDIFTFIATVRVKKFGKILTVRDVPVTDLAAKLLRDNPKYLFSGTREVLWIERGEDYYGSGHFKGKMAIMLDREKWLAAKLDDINHEVMTRVRPWYLK